VEDAIAITELFRRVPSWLVAGMLAVCATLASGSSVQGTAPDRARIQGRVRLTAAGGPAIPSGAYSARRVARPAAAASEIGNVVVFLDDVPRQPDLPAMRATIAQKDETFVPRVVAITRGSTVVFPNFDPYFHNVFSLSRDAFDLGRFPRGDQRTRTFGHAGLVKVYCHIHSHMSASIMVFDHPYFAIPSASGEFSIDDVPVGTWRVSAWHERIGASVQSVRLEAGQPATLEFALPVADR
jgi:plastocyanin